MARSRENDLFRVGNLLRIVFLLLAVSAANASPTVTHHDTILPTICPADSPTITACTINSIVTPVSAQLTNLGAELMQPPASPVGSTDVRNDLVKSLPAIPAAVLMVLVGFVCITLVRDRKVWLTVLTGLLWMGQTGIQTLPQLACHFSHKNRAKQQICAELGYHHDLPNYNRMRCDIEGTRYIGLLHHLGGIPEANSTYTSTTRYFTYSHKNTSTFRPAVLSEQHNLNLLFHCLVFKAEQFICFSPAFVFQTIPRGPPLLT